MRYFTAVQERLIRVLLGLASFCGIWHLSGARLAYSVQNNLAPLIACRAEKHSLPGKLRRLHKSTLTVENIKIIRSKT